VCSSTHPPTTHPHPPKPTKQHTQNHQNPTKTHQLAQPPPELVASLEALCDDPANLVFVISGRRKDDLQVGVGVVVAAGGGLVIDWLFVCAEWWWWW
jgi:hypothetical protein